MLRIATILLASLLLMGACVKQPVTPQQPSPPHAEKSIKAIITGIETFDGGHVMALSTAHGDFVVGPQVSLSDKQRVHEMLLAAQDRVITIFYVDKPKTKTTIAHKLVTGLDIQGKLMRFND